MRQYGGGKGQGIVGRHGCDLVEVVVVMISILRSCVKMAMPSSEPKESGSRHFPYCRKEKSLGLLCTNFLSLYDKDGVETIGLDEAATRLGVERRRIYDIVNVLESVGILARMAKNRYSWKGFRGIPQALQDLKEEGLRENYSTLEVNAKVSDDEDEKVSISIASSQDDKINRSSSVSSFSKASKTNNRKEKSLGLLTQNFIKLFLCSNVELISLDDAAKILLGDAHDPSIRRNNSAAKVRRLYDISNVLSSMNFVEKRQGSLPSGGWGIREKSENGSENAFVLNESKKRVFGTEITNTSFKRSKALLPKDGCSNQMSKTQLQAHVKCEPMGNEVHKSNLQQDSRQSSKGYRFGPFAPVSVSRAGAAEKNNVKQVHDWENLAATYRPEYHNQGIMYDLMWSLIIFF
ncbi:DP-E2F-like 1 [Actinidia rufa]|uniref:DP-E2F-like 1 n=1 Tax=Actinidia rufa TaxID=165716 RepID=A0A7J0DCY3_9ERIC|nr:DP-E2F-like 1 [Actinidia rufa]